MSHCCLCGLLCSLDCAATTPGDSAHESSPSQLNVGAIDNCHRRKSWLETSQPVVPGHATEAKKTETKFESGKTSHVDNDDADSVAAIAALFQSNFRTLIWIDGADVQTVRSVVKLAESTRAAIHVGQSTGATAAHNVLAGQGWLGSSLAEVASQADLIVTFGSGLRTEAPLLAERFIAPAQASGRAQWCHIASHSERRNGPSTSSLAPNLTNVWPREQWYTRLTHVMLALRGEQSADVDQENVACASLGTLVTLLQNATNTVWLWDAEEFHDAVDELCISRLLGISRLLSETARCSLLCLDSQVGRVTAKEALLWLTGCSGTAQYNGRQWVRPDSLAHTRLEEWQQHFDAILLIRSVPSVHPLPSLKASHFLVPESSLLPDGIDDKRVTHVAAVGVDCAGHLMRGDQATMIYCEASAPEFSEPELKKPFSPRTLRPTAAELLAQVLERIHVGASSHAH